MNLFRKHENTIAGQMKSELHRKKDRQRNLIPAKTGISILIMASINTIMYYAAYGLTSQTLDIYTRSCYLSFFLNLYPCFISPMIVLFKAPVIRRKINKSLSNMCEKFGLKNICYCKSVEFTTVTRPTDIPMSKTRRKY